MISSTAKLAQFLTSTQPESAPKGAFESAERTLIDTLGVALAGLTDPTAAPVDQWLATIGGAPTCTVWGRTKGASVAEAAFANAVRAHALDFDDSLPSLNGHPSSVLWPAALATGEFVGASGRDVLWAYILGLEVAGKLGRAVGNGHYAKGWHPTATVGVFSATTAAGRLLQLTSEQMQIALGIAASQASGLICNFGTMTKPLHVGHAARSGVMAAFLAKAGFTANAAVFDIKRGFLDAYAGSDGSPISELVESLGNEWEISNPGIYVKRWPCCYCTYRPIGGVLEFLEQHQFRVEDITEIRVGFPPGTADALILETPTSGVAAKFSTAYVLAALIVDRELSLATFTDEQVRRPEIKTLMAKIKSYDVTDSNVYNANVGYADLSISIGADNYHVRVERTPGSPQWPVTDEDLKEKFHLCCDAVAGQAHASTILSTAEQCKDLTSIRKLTALLSFKSKL